MSSYKNDNYKEFYKVMVNLSYVFPSITNESRLKSYYKHVKFLPDDGLYYIENVILDTYRIMPLPEDFKKLAYEWRRVNSDRFEKPIEVESYNICQDCSDTGYILCQINDKSPKVFMHCYCEKGEYNEKNVEKNKVIPRWIKTKMEVVFGFIKHKFPKEEFIPTKKDEQLITSSIDNIFTSGVLIKWQKHLDDSRRYWEKIKNN